MSLLLWKDMEGIFFGQLVWTSCSFDRRPAVAMPRFPEGAATSFRLLGPAGSGVSGSGMSPLAEEMIAERTDRGLRLSRHLVTFQKIVVKTLIESITVTLRRHGLKSRFKRNELGLFLVAFCSRTNISPWVVPCTA